VIIIFDEIKRTGEEVVETDFKILLRNLTEETEESNEDINQLAGILTGHPQHTPPERCILQYTSALHENSDTVTLTEHDRFLQYPL
jgi:hypothetical protein